MRLVHEVRSVFVCLKVMKRIKLTKRLQALADLVEKGASVADIGTDHGYLPVYLAQTHAYGKIFASDVSAASLAAAHRSAADYDVLEAITFITAPGLVGIIPKDTDTIVIAGLGGETIINILENAPWTKNHNVTLILQPQSKIDLLSRFLYDNGYEIKQTKSIIDKRKHYTVFLVTGEKLS